MEPASGRPGTFGEVLAGGRAATGPPGTPPGGSPSAPLLDATGRPLPGHPPPRGPALQRMASDLVLSLTMLPSFGDELERIHDRRRVSRRSLSPQGEATVELLALAASYQRKAIQLVGQIRRRLEARVEGEPDDGAPVLEEIDSDPLPEEQEEAEAS